jgi:hypothetical protein
LPYVRAVAIYFIMKGVVDGHLVVAVVVDHVRKKLEADAMTCPVIASRMSPGGCDEEVGVNRFV